MDIDIDFHHEIFMNDQNNTSSNNKKKANKTAKNIASEKNIEMRTLDLKNKSTKLQHVCDFEFDNV